MDVEVFMKMSLFHVDYIPLCHCIKLNFADGGSIQVGLIVSYSNYQSPGSQTEPEHFTDSEC